jgi:hypothetical protein
MQTQTNGKETRRYYSDEAECKILDLLRLNPQGLRQRDISKTFPKEPYSLTTKKALFFLEMNGSIVSTKNERFPKFFINDSKKVVLNLPHTKTVQGF